MKVKIINYRSTVIRKKSKSKIFIYTYSEEFISVGYILILFPITPSIRNNDYDLNTHLFAPGRGPDTVVVNVELESFSCTFGKLILKFQHAVHY